MGYGYAHHVTTAVDENVAQQHQTTGVGLQHHSNSPRATQQLPLGLENGILLSQSVPDLHLNLKTNNMNSMNASVVVGRHRSGSGSSGGGRGLTKVAHPLSPLRHRHNANQMSNNNNNNVSYDDQRSLSGGSSGGGGGGSG